MAEARIEKGLTLRTRFAHWWRRRSPFRRKSTRRTQENGRLPHTSEPRRPRAREIRALKRPLSPDQVQLWGALDFRNSYLLRTAITASRNDLSPDLFKSRFLEGLGRISLDPFKFANTFSNFSLRHILLIYEYGRLCERGEFKPTTYQAAELLIRESSEQAEFIDLLFVRQGLRYFMRTLEYLASQASNKHRAEVDQQQAQRDFEETMHFLNAKIKITFKQAEITALEIIAEKTRNEQFRVYRGLISAGEALAALENGSPADTAAVINKSGDREATRAIFISKVKESIPMLIEAAVHLTVDEGPKKGLEEAITQAITMAAEVLQNNPSRTPALANALAHLLSSKTKYVVTKERETRIAIIKNILLNAPAALPYLMQAHTDGYSIVQKSALAKALEPVIAELLQTVEGQNAFLVAAYALVAQQADKDIFIQQNTLRRAIRGFFGRKQLTAAIKSIIQTSKESSVPVFSTKSAAEEIALTLNNLAKQNDIGPNTKIDFGKASLLLYFALKFQQFAEAIREGVIGRAEDIYQDIFHMKNHYSNININLNCLSEYLEGIGPQPRGVKPTRNRTRSKIIEAANYHPILARRVIAVIEGNDEVWRSIPSPVDEATNGRAIENSLPRIAHYIRYAYCFLTAKKAEFGENNLKELSAALEADADKKQLFLTLQSLPPTVKDELFSKFFKQIVYSGHHLLAFEIQIFNRLLNLRMDPQVDRRALAQTILAALQATDGGRAWRKIEKKVQSKLEIDLINLEAFFGTLTENINKRIKRSEEGRILAESDIRVEIQKLITSIPDII
jgi:hypothetical protein